MKRLVLSVCALIVIAALALPAWFGALAHDQFTEGLHSTPQLPAYFTTEVVEYERGWFRSTGTIEIKLSDQYVDVMLAGNDDPMLQSMLRDAKLTFSVDVGHGPVVLEPEPFVGLSVTVVRLEPPEGGVSTWLADAGMPYLLEVRSRTSFGGTTKVNADVPPVDYQTPEGIQVTFSGFQASGTHDAATGRVLGSGGVDSLELSAGPAGMRMESLRFDADSTILEPGLWLGTVGAGIGRLNVALGGLGAAGDMDMRGLAMASTVESAGEDWVNASVTYGVDSVSGAGMALTNAKVGIAVNHLNAATVRSYNEWTSTAMLTSDGDEAALLAGMRDLAYDFLSDGPVITVDPVAFEYNGEPMRARLDVTFDASTLPPADRFTVEDPALWSRLVSAKGEVEAARALVRTLAIQNMMEPARAQMVQQGMQPADVTVEDFAARQAETMLASLVEQGLIAEDGDAYRADLAFGGGELTVNGRPLPMP